MGMLGSHLRRSSKQFRRPKLTWKFISEIIQTCKNLLSRVFHFTITKLPDRNDNNEAYIRQRELIKSAIETYGTDHIAGVTVGNEFMLK